LLSEVKKHLLTVLRAWDDAWHRGLRGERRRVLFDGESSMHFAMFETLYGCLRRDPRVQCRFTSSWADGLKAPLERICAVLGTDRREFVNYRLAQWRKWDLYVSSCFDLAWFARAVPWVDTFHGVGEKWIETGERLYMAHPLAARYDRLLCPNRRLAAQFERHPEYLKSPESLRVTGLAKSDTLVWLNTEEVRSALRAALPLKPGRPVVLLAPTWGPDGLLAQHLSEAIAICAAAEVNLIVKLHACSYLRDEAFSGGVNWRARLDEASRAGGFLHLPDASLTALILVADVMIADFGSAPVEYSLVDRPLLFWVAPGQAARSAGDRFQFELLSVAGGAVTSPADLQRKLAGVLGGSDGAAAHRRLLRETFFHAAGEATRNGLREMYGLMELAMPEGLVEGYRAERRDAILSDPAAFLGLGQGRTAALRAAA
jgi:hypothetical protein